MGTEAVQQAMTEMSQRWLMAHPILSWCITHPVWALGSGLLALFLMSGLLKAIARFAETFWVALLQAPLKGGRWAIASLLRVLRLQQFFDPLPIGSGLRVEPPQNSPLGADTELQYRDIMMRLEQIQQEQTLLLKDIKALLLKESNAAQLSQTRLTTSKASSS